MIATQPHVGDPNGFSRVRPVHSETAERPRLFVVVDTEEEFDWHAPFARANTSVTAMKYIGRTHELCSRFGLRPTYVIDHPVATQPEGFEQLAEWAKTGACVIGAHLHPWVNPPFNEEISNRNSFTCNLPDALQAAKIEALVQAIAANLAAQPRTFKAGRYGIGAAAIKTLERLGFEVDTSVNPTMDFRSVDGPDFSAYDSRPFHFGDAEMLEAPCTHGFVGAGRQAGHGLRRAAELPLLKNLRMPGVLARLGIVNQIMLSPEGNTFEEMAALTRALLGDGLRTFTFSFHSPSAAAGHTPYVRSERDLQDFLKRIERYFEFFFGEVAGEPSTPEDFRRALLGRTKAH